MLTLFILIVFSCSINSLWAGTPFKDCGSKLGVIEAFEVTDCPTAPCKFIKGKTYAMNLTFTAHAPSKTASVSIHGVIGGVPLPFPLPDSNACHLNVKCPISANDKNIASMSLPVLQAYPSLSLYVKLEISNDDQKQDYACLLFPATITSGSHEKKDLVGWKKGKLFEMLD